MRTNMGAKVRRRPGLSAERPREGGGCGYFTADPHAEALPQPRIPIRNQQIRFARSDRFKTMGSLDGPVAVAKKVFEKASNGLALAFVRMFNVSMKSQQQVYGTHHHSMTRVRLVCLCLLPLLVAGFLSCNPEELDECHNYDFGPFGPLIALDSMGLGSPLVCGSYLVCYQFEYATRSIVRINMETGARDRFDVADVPIGEMTARNDRVICFSSESERIYNMDIVSGEQIDLGIGSARSPSYSHDGRYLAVYSDEAGRVVVFDSLNNPVDTLLTDTPIGSVGYPTWSSSDYTMALTIGDPGRYKVYKYDFVSRTLLDSSQSVLGLTNNGHNPIKSLVWLNDSMLLGLNYTHMIACPLGSARAPGILSRLCDNRRLSSMDYHDGKLFCEVYSLLPDETGVYKSDHFVEAYDFPSLSPVYVYR